MPQKGHTNNPHGRPKGVKNKITERTKKALEALLTENLPKLKEEIGKLNGKDYVWAIDRILDKIMPRPSADVNVSAEVKTTATIQQQRDKAVLDKLPPDLIALMGEHLQLAMQEKDEKVEDNPKAAQEPGNDLNEKEG